MYIQEKTEQRRYLLTPTKPSFFLSPPCDLRTLAISSKRPRLVRAMMVTCLKSLVPNTQPENNSKTIHVYAYYKKKFPFEINHSQSLKKKKKLKSRICYGRKRSAKGRAIKVLSLQ